MATAETEGNPESAATRKIQNPAEPTHKPGRLFNGIALPDFLRYSQSGDQSGLGNLYWAEHGKALMSTMYQDWREQWGRRIIGICSILVGVVCRCPKTITHACVSEAKTVG